MGQITVTKAPIDGLYVIEPTVHGDSRGYFVETYNQHDMHEAGLDMVFVQDNQSMSRKGVLRGLHFQKQFPQGKLVRVIQGSVFDVAVDLRAAAAPPTGIRSISRRFAVILRSSCPSGRMCWRRPSPCSPS